MFYVRMESKIHFSLGEKGMEFNGNHATKIYVFVQVELIREM